jgi:hypothetical protein
MQDLSGLKPNMLLWRMSPSMPCISLWLVMVLHSRQVTVGKDKGL